jgi:hypothetical protein
MDLNKILKSLKVANSDNYFWQYTGNPINETEYNSSVIFYNTDENGNAIKIAHPYSWSKIENEKINVALQNLREKRNNLIAETDYLALSDQTMTAEMTAYRQALRDITNGLTTVEQVNAVVWPERPEV